MGLLRSLKRLFNRADAYDQLTTVNRYRLILGNERVDGASKAMYDQLNQDEGVNDDGEQLPDVELDRYTSAEALAKRDSAIERERQRRESGQ
jgi:hypothetical protein